MFLFYNVKFFIMNKNLASVRIKEIYNFAEKEKPDLFKAYTNWDNSTKETEETSYNALVKLIHSNRSVCIGMPLSHSNEVNLWRACKVIEKMIKNGEDIKNWKFVEEILKNDDSSQIWLNSYFKDSVPERFAMGLRSLFDIISSTPATITNIC